MKIRTRLVKGNEELEVREGEEVIYVYNLKEQKIKVKKRAVSVDEIIRGEIEKELKVLIKSRLINIMFRDMNMEKIYPLKKGGTIEEIEEELDKEYEKIRISKSQQRLAGGKSLYQLNLNAITEDISELLKKEDKELIMWGGMYELLKRGVYIDTYVLKYIGLFKKEIIERNLKKEEVRVVYREIKDEILEVLERLNEEGELERIRRVHLSYALLWRLGAILNLDYKGLKITKEDIESLKYVILEIDKGSVRRRGYLESSLELEKLKELLEVYNKEELVKNIEYLEEEGYNPREGIVAMSEYINLLKEVKEEVPGEIKMLKSKLNIIQRRLRNVAIKRG